MIRISYFISLLSIVLCFSLHSSISLADDFTITCERKGGKKFDLKITTEENKISAVELHEENAGGNCANFQQCPPYFGAGKNGIYGYTYNGRDKLNFELLTEAIGFKASPDFKMKIFPNGNMKKVGPSQIDNGAPIRDGWKWKCDKNRDEIAELWKKSETMQSNSMASNTADDKALSAAEEKTKKLEQRLAALEAQQSTKAQNSSSFPKTPPTITIFASKLDGAEGVIEGRVTDDVGITKLTADGSLLRFSENGEFSFRTYVPEGGMEVNVEAENVNGLIRSVSIPLNRQIIDKAVVSFDKLNPLIKQVQKNNDALALIIGVADYKEEIATAIYADSDAKVFRDYVVKKLGVPENRVKTLINEDADEKGFLLSIKKWLSRLVIQEKTDVYIFFAGHGLASDDGKKAYLLPYDGAPELLDKTAILRGEIYQDISKTNPRSVTVFLDTCYSGTTRGPDMLIASRPIAIKAKKSAIPDGFTVFTAAGGDQTAKPLEEAKHGMFSYFLMKGMEGDADSNQDNQITAAELHQYVEQNVVQQSGGSQVPELQGDANRVLVRFQ